MRDPRPLEDDVDGCMELGRRDVDGDGVIERIFGDPCMSIAIPAAPATDDFDGWEAITDPWCCGC